MRYLSRTGLGSFSIRCSVNPRFSQFSTCSCLTSITSAISLVDIGLSLVDSLHEHFRTAHGRSGRWIHLNRWALLVATDTKSPDRRKELPGHVVGCGHGSSLRHACSDNAARPHSAGAGPGRAPASAWRSPAWPLLEGVQDIYRGLEALGGIVHQQQRRGGGGSRSAAGSRRHRAELTATSVAPVPVGRLRHPRERRPATRFPV